jgi:hypothetical protein
MPLGSDVVDPWAGASGITRPGALFGARLFGVKTGTRTTLQSADLPRKVINIRGIAA